MSKWSRMGRAAAAASLLVLGPPGVDAQVLHDTIGEQRASLPSFSRGLGARALGMGGAFIAVADDASATFWNPAGLGGLQRRDLSVVWQAPSRFETRFAPGSYPNPYLAVSTDIQAPRTLSASSRSLDSVSLTMPVGRGRFRWVPQVSYQRVVDYGLDSLDSYAASGAVEYGGTPGASQSHRSSVKNSTQGSGGIDVVAAALAGGSERLRFGIAVNRWIGSPRSTVLSEAQSGFRNWGRPESRSELAFDLLSRSQVETTERFAGTNVNLGVLVRPFRSFSAGLVYKSPFGLKWTHQTTTRCSETYAMWRGSAHERDAGESGSRSYVSVGPRDQELIDWPRTLGAGLAFRPSPSLTLSADMTHSSWSRAERRGLLGEDTGRLVSQWPTLVDARVVYSPADPQEPEHEGFPKQTDTRQLRLGGEYVVRRPGFGRLHSLPIRAGVFSDRQLFKTHQLQNVDFYGATLGVGLAWSRFAFDFAYVHVWGDYKCCERVLPEGGIRATFLEDGNDRYRSRRFYVTSSLKF